MPPTYPDTYPSLILRLGDLELAVNRIAEGSYNRARQQGAQVEYSYDGTPILKGHNHAAKYIWTVTTYLDYQEQKILKAIAERSDLLMHSPPYQDYEITLSDLVVTVSEPTQTRGKASYFLDTETLGVVSYFAQFKVVLPLQSIEEVSAGHYFQVSFQLVETALDDQDAPSSQLEPPLGGNPVWSGGFNTPILLGQLPSQVVTSNNIAANLTWPNISGKPDLFPTSWDLVQNKPTIVTAWGDITGKPATFPSTWATVSGKPSSFPSSWAEVSGKPSSFPSDWSTLSGIPDLAYQSELDTVTNNLLGVIGSVNDNFASYLPRSGGALTGALSLASIANALTGANLSSIRLGDASIHTNNFFGVTQAYVNDTGTAPFTRNPLVISHHTGVSLSSFSGYGGTRIFAASANDPFNYDGNLVAQFNFPRSMLGVPLSIGGGTPGSYSLEVNGDIYSLGYTRVSGSGIFGEGYNKYLQPAGQVYGAWRILGEVNGWNGLSFVTGSNSAELAHLVGHSSQSGGNGTLQSGMYEAGVGWHYHAIGTTFYAGTYANLSDASLKEEIQPLGDGLEAIKGLNPVAFKWKPGKGQDRAKHNGFLAQQLEANPKLNHLVRRSYQGIDEEGNPKDEKLSIVITEIVPLLVKAVQELDDQVSRMGSRVRNFDQFDSNMASIMAAVNNLNSDMTSMATEVNQATSSINATNTSQGQTLGQQQIQLTTIQASLNGITAQIASLASQLSSVQALAQTNSQRLDKITPPNK